MRVPIARVTPGLLGRRFQSTLKKEQEEVFTKLSDEQDPKRDAFFQYTWGSWLKNDKEQKAQRFTRFSIEGANVLLDQFVKQSIETTKTLSDDLKIAPVVQPKSLGNGVTVLPQNLNLASVGVVNPNEKIHVKQMSSIHEGKHHRIYKLDTTTDRSFVLRIPYPLESELFKANKIKSEVATMDFALLKLGMNVPKVFAYGTDSNNPLQTPFILMEFIEGPLLMKNWNPLVSDFINPESKTVIKKVLDPILDLQKQLLSVEFNLSGSLYFFDDVNVELQKKLPYDGESDEALKNRWRIGPFVERTYYRNKKYLKSSDYENVTGPFENPLDVITSIGQIELEQYKRRLSLAESDSSSIVENVDELKHAIKVYEDLLKIAPVLFNTENSKLPNNEQLWKPRLYHPDLDPMNVILKDEVPYLMDFESTSIKPFILQNYPGFVAYEGPKVYNLKEDVENYEKLDDLEKQQYEFMYNRTRNQFLWEFTLNERRKDLLGAISPLVKLLRSPYIAALDNRSEKDYLYVESAMVNLQQFWNSYLENGLVGGEFPIEYSETDLDNHFNKIEKYQQEISSTPFIATKGWIPQDMFEKLKEQGFLKKNQDGDYVVDTEELLKEIDEEE